ncbi:hypothetical protein [Flavobacterium laiguense]|uniref:Outer membrane protein beta-barrel domain-containing protein n=1 Tax=Flavobacterium laiguense TaxID=2169409 RepID=A0A2U1JMY6_9FLAO|nr:hypothetical protein [Flavobacterium laiguense]PWA06344.1 hypothetical protein DB891_15685 [Flavobacterium laiguense]
MKKLLFVAGILLSGIGAKAQTQGSIGLNLYGGYTFEDQISNNASYIEIQDGFQYGIGAEFYVRPSKSIELKYLRMDTSTPVFAPSLTAPFKVGQINVGNDSSAINYVLIGGNNYFQTANPSLIPFIGLDLGLGWASGDQSTSARFAWDFKAGVKIKASDVVSVKLQGYFQTIWGSYGSETYYYPGWGTVTYPNNSSLYQFGLGAAFAFDFK